MAKRCMYTDTLAKGIWTRFLITVQLHRNELWDKETAVRYRILHLQHVGVLLHEIGCHGWAATHNSICTNPRAKCVLVSSGAQRHNCVHSAILLIYYSVEPLLLRDRQQGGGAQCLLTIPLELFIPFMLIFVTNLTVGGASGYLGPHSTFRLYILFS